MTDEPLTEQEVREIAEAITGGEGDDRDGWYGAAEARVLAHDWLRLQQRLAEAERERDEARAALERIGNTLSIDTAWQIARDALEQE